MSARPQPPTGLSHPEAQALTELWVVRHGESTWNAVGRYQGQTDVPLSEVGVLQASSLAERLTGRHFAAVYSSDLKRASHTAEIVTERLEGAPAVQLDTGLREIDVGELGGLNRSDIRSTYPEFVAALEADPWLTRRPGGESMADLQERSSKAFKHIAARHRGESVIVFTHGGVVRVAVGLALGGVPQNAWARLSVANTSITRILLGQSGGILLGFNDAAHLEDLEAAGEADDLGLGATP
ncbi:histidine phosphatase family protein [Deinococcus sp.]|uniref:histidine phosphatase family protein n=1 Tax=Deinococcus sp. TaxID=47478 RepID=UPI003B5AFAC4